MPDVERLGIQVTLLNAIDAAASFAFFVEQVLAGTVAHRSDGELTAALTAASKRPLTDGGHAWSRRNSNVNIDPLVACTIALWGAGRQTPIFLWGDAKDYERLRLRKISEAWGTPNAEDEKYDMLFKDRPEEKWSTLLRSRGLSDKEATDAINGYKARHAYEVNA